MKEPWPTDDGLQLVSGVVAAEERPVQKQFREDAAHTPHIHRFAVAAALTELHVYV